MTMMPALIFLVWTILVLSTLLTILFVYIVLQRIRQNRETVKIKQFKKQHSTSLYLYLTEGEELPNSCIPVTKWKRKAIEEMLSSYMNNLAGDMVTSQVNAYTELYLQDYYRKQLRNHKWSTRLNVLYKIADFHMYFLIDDVVQLLNSKQKYSKDEYFQMYRLLAIFRHEAFWDHLLRPKKELGELDYKKLFTYLDQHQLEMIIEQYEKLPVILQKSVIEIVGSKHLSEFSFFLEERLKEDILEIRIRSLKSIAQIGLIRDVSLYLPFAQSVHWEERMMVAKLLANIPLTMSKTYLYNLLKDSSWWVRFQAAHSILSHKNGVEMLERIITSTDDRFAMDMAKAVLGKG